MFFVNEPRHKRSEWLLLRPMREANVTPMLGESDVLYTVWDAEQATILAYTQFTSFLIIAETKLLIEQEFREYSF